jgi:hypothetical protein
MHLLGQSTYEFGDDAATGLVYCLAHHVRAGTDLVLHIRHHDGYRRDDSGRGGSPNGWCASGWTKTRAVDPVRATP